MVENTALGEGRWEEQGEERWIGTVAPYLGPLAEVVGDFTALTGVPVDLPTALFLRARLAGLGPPGRTSAGGSCRLLATADGWAAVNLARPDDTAALPALLALLGAPGADLPGAARNVTSAELACSAQLLGIPAAAHASAGDDRPPVRAARHGERRPRALAGLRILDLSALWAGPLCARLLGLAGAEVTKVESDARPDGARSGPPDFYRWLHDGHESRVLDFATGAVAALAAEADVVVEASRPRALRRLGVHAERFLAARPGRVWVSITGYGRDDDRIAFGDDAAVAGGLTGRDPHGAPVFLGDALADPVTGLYAAHATARSLAAGGGELLCVSMSACAAALARSGGPAAVTGGGRGPLC
ncbi:CoA transferase [Streptomyces sp. NBC_01275]|uniref:CoA transferase n=1 Tax=Streptomyces sp. NBC_01275 TaxID=2903807 RepID=UPI00225A1124|nr:CoA transferase [Streptomyces sp. NBC_01275]MCX4766540.1 CoA transferase [Streptomyces sp. NBC_01275]